ncbi:MAG: class I SAM-dependent methyltransferase [Sphingobium sp.]
MNRRIHGEKTIIDPATVERFFQMRSEKFGGTNPVVSMLYQDSNPALAQARDAHEKAKLLPLLDLSPEDRVLDMGCGLGRWAGDFQGRVARYHGTDLVANLIEIARKTFADDPAISFEALPAQDNRADMLACPPPFSVILIAGVLHYINDADCRAAVANVLECAAPAARILVRGPVAVEQRLTLDTIWSEELSFDYSAVYRTEAEYRELFAAWLDNGFEMKLSERLFPTHLNNRRETEQHFFLLERKG